MCTKLDIYVFIDFIILDKVIKVHHLNYSSIDTKIVQLVDVRTMPLHQDQLHMYKADATLNMLHKCDVKLYLCVQVNNITLNMLHKCDVKLYLCV